MKNIIFCVCITGIIYPAEVPPFHHHKKSPDMAEQWAQYTSKQSEESQADTRRRNRLNDDPEQQEEHTQGCYYDTLRQLHKIEHAIAHKNNEKKLEEYELACRVIVQALIHFHDAGNKKALEQAETRALALVARIKLMQDPFWHVVIQNIAQKKEPALAPVYSADELGQDLYIPESKKDRLIKLLLAQLEAKEHLTETFSAQAVEELSKALAPHRKKPEEIIAIFSKIDQLNPVARIKNKKRAIELYNGAVTSEIQADIKFLHLKDKHEYLGLEQAYCTVALLYLQAHDYGHPNGLAEAEKIMLGGTMETIVRWKARHSKKDALEQYGEIWKEINTRKYSHTTQAGPPSSSSPASSSPSS